MNTTILLATLTLLCAVAAVPVPELPAQSIDLVKIPLSGDKVSYISRSYTMLINCNCTANKSRLRIFLKCSNSDLEICRQRLSAAGVNVINRCLLC